jgi:uncharacterized protein (DUF4415 family)
MARKPNPGLIDDDAPELTDAELAEMRPAREVLAPEVYEVLTRGKVANANSLASYKKPGPLL